MLKNHLKIAWRNLKRRLLFSAVNILGLSIGLSSAFLIYFWVTDEYKVDRFHANGDRLYQIMEKSTENGIVQIHDGTQGPLSDALEKDIPEVENAVTVMDLGKEGMSLTLRNGVNTFKSEGLFAGKAFFETFSFPLLVGRSGEVLLKKESVVISENLAAKLYGSPNKAIGQSIEYEMFGIVQNGLISGIFRNPPGNSTLQFDYVATKQKFVEDIWTNGLIWENTGPQTYVMLKANVDMAAFDRKIEHLIDRYSEYNTFTLFTRKFTDTYLRGNFENGVQTGGRITYIRLMGFIAVLILLIACINFMNLSTARVSRRFKEIGIKKTIGGTKKVLIFQFLSESVLLTYLSLILALVLVIASIPLFNFITGKELGLRFSLGEIAFILVTTLITGLISGSYPAFYLANFSPLAALTGKLHKVGSVINARKGLVVFQFMASLVLIISVLVINEQVRYALNKPVGFERDHVVSFDLEGKAYAEPQVLFDELDKIEGVVGMGAITESIISEEGGSSTYGLEWPGKIEGTEIDFIIRNVDEDLMKTLGIEIAEGQGFNRELGAPETFLILNKEAIKLMGLKDPVGRKVQLWGEEKTILGVMRDFNTASVMQPISPVIFAYSANQMGKAMLKLQTRMEQKALEQIEAAYIRFNPGYQFNFSFLDQTFEKQYLSEKRILSLGRYFAYLAVFISCLGLFGLAAFDTELRNKEISIRKVLGSTSLGIFKLLSTDFIKLVLIAIVIATPIAWYVMQDWLSQFAYHISISWRVFAISGLATILTAIVTISFQVIRAAVANPVKGLRTE